MMVIMARGLTTGGVVGQAAKIPLGYLAHLDGIPFDSFMAGDNRRGQNWLKYHAEICDE